LNTGKPAEQISSAHDYNGAEKANDGIYDPTEASVSSLAYSGQHQRPWWRVNLERVFTVYAV